MRTAEEIIYEHFFPDQVEDLEVFKQMINEARKEAIEECAKIASNHVFYERTPEYDDVHFLIIELINKLK